MLVDALVSRVAEKVETFTGRIHRAAELTELVRQKALPQGPATAFVLPLGIRPMGPPDAFVGAFTQMIDEIFGVLIVVRAAGDVTGGRALPTIDRLCWAVIAAICGWAPDQPVQAEDEPPPPRIVGTFRLSRGALVSAEAGLVIYQLDFALQQQVRIIP